MNVVDTPRLSLQTAAGIQTFQLVEREIWTLGRDKSNHIRLADRFASRFHAKLCISEHRHCYFWDLNSRNGSLVNGQPIVGSVFLKHGDRITIGDIGLLFQHNFVTLSAFSQAELTEQVMMLQASAVQGKIWQDMLLSHGISACWEIRWNDLRDSLTLKAATSTLPRLLILDVQAYKDDIYRFCDWCRTQYPTLNLLLIDSSRTEIPLAEQTYLIKQGCLQFFPAFQSHRLLQQQAEILQQAALVLKVFPGHPFRSLALLSALKSLDQLFNQAKNTSHDLDGEPLDLDELTSLQCGKPRSKNSP
ncbi:MAG: FHA domain-containing protein [Thermosynechococcaceae cyanobacterium]